MKIINWDLIANPLNWLTVILMLLLASFVVDLLAQFLATNFRGVLSDENA
jgi:uncharacterized protein involved in cysteine biosynthesis